MTINLRTAFTWILGVGLIGGILFLPALYNLGLLLSPPLPAPARTPAPPLIRAALWANAEGTGKPHMVPLTPWSLFSLITCAAYASATTDAKNDNDPVMREKQDACFDQQAGLMLAGHLSKEHIAHAGVRDSPRVPLAGGATMANFTRNWEINAVLDTLAAESDFGHGWRGAAAASQGFFRKDPASLAAHEAALLVVQIPIPISGDPYCNPPDVVKRRNRVLDRMHRNGAIDDHVLAEAAAAPLGVVPGKCPSPPPWMQPGNP